MWLKKRQQEFVAKLENIYAVDEAKNIFELAIEYLTGINIRSEKSINFKPDGCFIKMFDTIEQRLCKHEPIQYIINEAWFYDIPFYVDKRVLIPRPETEELVEWIIKDFDKDKDPFILDVGAGSGCIPIILKRKIPAATITSCDISPFAIEVASKNALKYNTDIKFLELNFLDEDNWSKLEKVDIIVSNPPYIPQSDSKNMLANVLQYEPHNALFVENNHPLVFYDSIAKAGKLLLNTNGSIYVEIHENLAIDTLQLFKKHGYSCTLKKDMQQKDRFIKAIAN